jgi:hypothetical protein
MLSKIEFYLDDARKEKFKNLAHEQGLTMSALGGRLISLYVKDPEMFDAILFLGRERRANLENVKNKV